MTTNRNLVNNGTSNKNDNKTALLLKKKQQKASIFSATSSSSAAEDPPLAWLDLFYILLGSAPILCIAYVAGILVYKDYKMNNDNFWGQSRFFSNTKPHQLWQNKTCQPDWLDQHQQLQNDHFTCGRHFTDHVVTNDESKKLLRLAKTGIEHQTDPDASSIFYQYEAGVLNQDGKMIDVRKQLQEKNETLHTQSDLEFYDSLNAKLGNYAKKKFNLPSVREALPRAFIKMSNHTGPKFSLSKKFNKKQHCVTALVFLNDFVIDFDGGQIVFNNNDKGLVISIQGRAGRLVMFTSGEENRHFFEEVWAKYSYMYVTGFECGSGSGSGTSRV